MHLKVGFGLKLFSCIALIFIPGFFYNNMPLSLAWLLGLFGWLLAEPPSHHFRQYARTLALTTLAFPILGIIFNLCPDIATQLCFVILSSVLAVYLSSRFWLPNLGFAIQFMTSSYMALADYPVQRFYYWPLQLTIGSTIYALYSLLWGGLWGTDRHHYPRDPRHAEYALTLAWRLAVGLSLSAVIAQWAGLHRSFWVLMTVGLVLQEDTASTVRRALERTLGTFLGCAYALLLMQFNLPTVAWLFLLSVALPLAYSAAHKWYLFSVSFYTLSVAFLSHYIGTQTESVLSDRSLDTLLGSSLAVVSVAVTSKMPWFECFKIRNSKDQ
ncbi:FUSC family protein [Paraburkholderia humisilvae]|uniref:Integral membrane bound transporter domain-containing protein n=1 Tax=Paraburkholderia humisilvae TaxID=627669 RepID=A0A6J5F9C6_9BURK|nr:FUSC family protein [Paraburkholderia humisilvae]CAB3774983.1 hypothetical protein LMG29542_08365 [Paraburkholderia humisilvae]